MKACTKGAVLLDCELAILDEALEWAIENVESMIGWNHCPDPRNATQEELKLEKVREKVLADYKLMQTKLKRIGANRVLLDTDRRRPGYRAGD